MASMSHIGIYDGMNNFVKAIRLHGNRQGPEHAEVKAEPTYQVTTRKTENWSGARGTLDKRCSPSFSS
jgi:hypothetical protein